MAERPKIPSLLPLKDVPFPGIREKAASLQEVTGFANSGKSGLYRLMCGDSISDVRCLLQGGLGFLEKVGEDIGHTRHGIDVREHSAYISYDPREIFRDFAKNEHKLEEGDIEPAMQELEELISEVSLVLSALAENDSSQFTVLELQDTLIKLQRVSNPYNRAASKAHRMLMSVWAPPRI